MVSGRNWSKPRFDVSNPLFAGRQRVSPMEEKEDSSSLSTILGKKRKNIGHNHKDLSGGEGNSLSRIIFRRLNIKRVLLLLLLDIVGCYWLLL